MHIYLPIAELSANMYYLVALGAAAGLLSGMFGIGGGFILTPMLMFMGVPAAVAVATSTNMIVASSFSGFLSHYKRDAVDVRMGIFLILGGVIGAYVGIDTFSSLQRAGQIDLMIALLYVALLGTVSILFLREAMALSRNRDHTAIPLTLPRWVGKLPLQTHFERSNVTHSILLPIFLGVASGLLVGLLGIGGGFILIPLMVYILRMPPDATVGTSLFQIIFITTIATMLHAITTHTVDILLAVLLLAGSVVGAQFGVRIARHIPAHLSKALMAVLLLCVATRLAYGLFITPPEIFTLTLLP